ncbi:heme exporter protein CcmD [Microvirga brassicacearum]|uniref:Heme exporter protein D n=2 Tax=Microvirga brassicacearum TaxID=2580413 RepID=A0A5N3P4Y6_9HYPH|nr:heme exporter protein CcmD [Microvirga brassicacearum]
MTMPHAVFIAGAYGVTLLIVAGLIVRAVIDFRLQKRALARLEARGAGRRSARQKTPQGAA